MVHLAAEYRSSREQVLVQWAERNAKREAALQAVCVRCLETAWPEWLQGFVQPVLWSETSHRRLKAAVALTAQLDSDELPLSIRDSAQEILRQVEIAETHAIAMTQLESMRRELSAALVENFHRYVPDMPMEETWLKDANRLGSHTRVRSVDWLDRLGARDPALELISGGTGEENEDEVAISLSSFSRRQRQVLEALSRSPRSLREIGEEIGISGDDVRKHLRLAQKKVSKATSQPSVQLAWTFGAK